MTKNELKDAIKVIKAVKKLGVTKMKFGTLEFEIGPIEPRAVRPAFKVSEKEIEDMDAKNQLQWKFDEAKDDIASMHVEDPVGYERAIIEQELEDGEGNIEETTQNF